MTRLTGNLNIYNNPSWPPRNNSLILIQKKQGEFIYIGKVIAILTDSDTCVVSLLNDKHYKSDMISGLTSGVTFGSVGNMVVAKNDMWNYVNVDKMKKILKMTSGSVKNIEDVISKKFMKKYEDDDITPPEANKCVFDDDVPDDDLYLKKEDKEISNLFTDSKANVKISTTGKDESIDAADKTYLLNKLKEKESIKPTDTLYASSEIGSKTLLSDDDINGDGHKIISLLTDRFKNKVVGAENNKRYPFKSLRFAIYGGYVHVARSDVELEDKITTTNVPGLETFGFQYDKPIQYDVLKYALFNTTTTDKTRDSENIKKEITKIFAQEYQICLQPKPNYQYWTIKRLIMAWFADDRLNNNIRKFKILINQYRANPKKRYNKMFGLLPSIVVYPKYGSTSTKTVLEQLSKTYAFYPTLRWDCSYPTYFTKFTDLIWFTNGNIDLKMYYRRIERESEKIKNKSFTKSFESVVNADKIVNDI